MKLRENEKTLIFILTVFVVFMLLFFIQHVRTQREIKVELQREEARLTDIKRRIDELPIIAEAVSVLEVETGKEIYGKNEDSVLPIASLAKILTVPIALLYTEERDVQIEKSDLSERGDNGLIQDEVWDKVELAKFSLLVSSNDGTHALAKGVEDFLNIANNKARKLGLINTMFFNISGLDISPTEAGALSTAREVNYMALYAYRSRPEIFAPTTELEYTFRSISGFEHKVLNTNVYVNRLPNVIFSKTGNTNLAGGNLTAMFGDRTGNTYLVTLLGSTVEGRFGDMEKIAQVLYNLSNEN
jgi:D-alanyl-D-alanine carboxypeptidase